MDPKSSMSNHSISTLTRGDLALKACARSVRKLEEAINRLTSENFNLKLRNFTLEEAQRRSKTDCLRHSDSYMKLEEELQKTRQEIKVLNMDNEGLKKKFSKYYDTDKANKRLEKTVLEKEAILKDAAMIIQTYQQENYKTELFVDGIRGLLKAYDES